MESKNNKRNLVYNYISRMGKVSRPSITNDLGISMPTVLQSTKELFEEGLVCEVGEFESTGGRKAKMISPVLNYKYSIGIDVTRNHLSFVLTDLSRKVLKHKRQHKVYKNDRHYYKSLAEAALEFLEASKIPEDSFLGFGISIPGIIDSKEEKIERSHALEIRDISCSIFSQFIPYDCKFTNDANAALIAEINNLKDRDTTVYLSLSNSVGGSIFTEMLSNHRTSQVVDNIYFGDNCRSGEFGHMILHSNGKECYCGKKGCVDSYCSAKLLADYTGGNLRKFFKELESGNEEFKDVWDTYLTDLAITVNNLRMVFDCKIIIGGYVGSFMEPYISYLQERATELNTFENDSMYINSCAFKVEASALGAALRHIEEFISLI